MSLRKTAKILGVSPTYLSLLLNGKRPWRGNLKERYAELVNTFVNSPNESGYEITGAQGGIRTHTPDKGKRILSPPRLPFRHLGRCIGLLFALLDLCANQQRQAPHQYYTDTSKAGSNSPGSRTVALCSSVPPFQQPASRSIT